ncbi:RNA polymerase sigma factor RpoH [Geobacter sp. SVR]|uniref:RNA polymerase sigma factor RpoH n=1 Tax=Geobacter sp. SVR TaxID=2495594 RepID=UPI00143F015C|nr:RNA polymerase sigma factor RpoH [Geobacter sp. SVR]BCS53041.1 RNA polymerase sigma factor RpoH [Geobacter sp. SVR]GCF84426.1 RNA polymerase sigma factor RpoH [Geobacter sp. SVR]
MVAHLPVVADSLSLYLAEIRKFPLMSEEEEHRTAVAFYERKELAAAHALITSNLRFVVKVAHEYRHYGLKMLDLIQEGNIGLMLAVRKFNPYKGIRLISYAVWWIKAYIQNHIISAWSLLKIGTTQAQRKLFFKLREAKNAILRLSDGDDDVHLTAQALNVSDREVIEMEQRLHGEYSLDAELPGSDGVTVLDGIADERMNQEELLSEYESNHRLKQEVANIVAGLNEKERFVIEARVTADEPMTLQEIASHFSISRERVRQIEEAALKKMKQALLPVIAAA